MALSNLEVIQNSNFNPNFIPDFEEATQPKENTDLKKQINNLKEEKNKLEDLLAIAYNETNLVRKELEQKLKEEQNKTQELLKKIEAIRLEQKQELLDYDFKIKKTELQFSEKERTYKKDVEEKTYKIAEQASIIETKNKELLDIKNANTEITDLLRAYKKELEYSKNQCKELQIISDEHRFHLNRLRTDFKQALIKKA